MAGLTRTTRAPHEVAALRAFAEHVLTRKATQRSAYMQRRCAAVIATCDWIAEDRVLSPATDSELRPDEHGRALERMRGTDLEDERRTARSGDSVTPGVVAETLLWFDLDPDGGDGPL